MSDDSNRTLQKHTLELYPGDFDRLRDLHPNASVGSVIRTLVRKHIERVESASPIPQQQESQQ